MNAKKRQLIIGLTSLAILGVVVVYVGVSSPFPCRHRKHILALEERCAAWRRSELTNEQALQRFIAYAELKPSFGEKSTWRDEDHGYFGGYSSLHYVAIKMIGEVNTPEAFDTLCRYATCSNRELNANAVRVLDKQGDKRAVPALMKLLEIEDRRELKRREAAAYSHNPHLLTCHILCALKKLIGPEAAPLLKEFLAEKDRIFKNEVEKTVFELENDITKPINIERHQVTIKLKKTNFRPGEDMMLDYSITSPVGEPVKLCAFGDTVLIDGKAVRVRNPDVYLGGYYSHGGLSLAGLSPGEHTITVTITGTDKSDSATFYILEQTIDTPESLSGDN